MKRSLIVTVLASAVVVAVTSLASAVPVEQRGNPEEVTSKVTPKTERTRPYTFRTRGSVVLPPRWCAPGARPGEAGSRTNCVPIKCPPGVTDARYCTRPTITEICSGELQIKFKRGTTTYSSRRTDLDPDCDYSSSATITRRIRRGELRVTVVFLGNDFLNQDAASTKYVNIGR